MSDTVVVRPGLWEPSTLGALCEVDPEVLGASTPRDYRFRYIDISSVSPLSISEELQETSFALAPSRARKKVRRNDVLMATVRPNLKAFARVKGDADLVASTGFAVLRARDGVSDPGFIEQVLFTSGIESQIEGLVAGSSYPAITVANVKRLKLTAPPVAEQRRIADLLSALDEQLEVSAETTVKLEALRKGLFQEMLRRNPPSELIGHHFHLRSGSTPSRAREDYYSENGTPWVKTLDLNEAELVTTDENVSALALTACPVTVHPRGTVLVAMYGGWEQIGRTAILGTEACTNQAITALRPKAEGAWEPGFVLMALQALRHRWRQFAVSTRKDPNITKSDIARFLLPHPSLKDQQEWGRRFEALSSLIRAERDANQKKRLQKSALLQKLLSNEGQAWK